MAIDFDDDYEDFDDDGDLDDDEHHDDDGDLDNDEHIDRQITTPESVDGFVYARNVC
jgi:hypothetical protein